MKKFMTCIVAVLLSGNLFAQSNGVVELSWATMVKDAEGLNAADQSNIEFYSDVENNVKSGFILQPTGGRTQAGPMERENCSGKALNFKNNTNQMLVIPEGTKVYKINFYGWSQGDNWTYLYAYGPDPANWEWTDPIGEKQQGNTNIIDNAKYPLDPCVVNEANVKDSETIPFHNAGYCFASIDFGTEPYEGTFAFVFNGNNQERAWMEVFTTRESADAAPVQEAPRLGKDKSNTTGVEEVFVVKKITDSILYNIAGQRVDKSYKGLIIMNGHKFMKK